MNGWAILSVSRRDTATYDNRIVGKLEGTARGDSTEPGPTAIFLLILFGRIGYHRGLSEVFGPIGVAVAVGSDTCVPSAYRLRLEIGVAVLSFS